jgi:dipeptidyl aminopeptidase/acylaminoacyl peptidase
MRMRTPCLRGGWLGLVCLAASMGAAADPAGFDAAAAFGARPDVFGMSLAPDGKTIAYLVPLTGQGVALKTLVISQDSDPKVAMYSTGRPERITGCSWVANDRLVCSIYEIGPAPLLFAFSRLVAVNTDGSNLQLLTKPHRFELYDPGGGSVVDWLPDLEGSVLMSRVTAPGEGRVGLGVDRLDTRTLLAISVQEPIGNAVGYLSDQRGNVRIMARRYREGFGYDTTAVHFYYRTAASDKWQELCTYNTADRTGFEPLAIDADQNLVYGVKKLNGRLAVYTLKLDGSRQEALVYSRDDVDVYQLLTIGRRHRVIGMGYVTDYRRAQYTDHGIEQLSAALANALPGHIAPSIIDASLDESRLLLYASSDTDPGTYYVFDRTTHQLGTLLEARARLAGVTLGRERPVTYSARDGTSIPAYLTLPPGSDSVKGLPALVMPHGGPSARDEWGFNWLVQFFAKRGYAVLQPNFRGSAGYGDAWYETNGIKSWKIAVSDVLDAGRWLVAQGADSGRLAIVGWSYGGYAALQSEVLEPGVFKAAVAIAPVTDFADMMPRSASLSSYFAMREFLGSGTQLHEGSPAENATRIRVPVLIFHGTSDRNVPFAQSEKMDRALTAAGVKHEFVKFDGLDHHLDDSAARAELLRRSDTFLRAAFATDAPPAAAAASAARP